MDLRERGREHRSGRPSYIPSSKAIATPKRTVGITRRPSRCLDFGSRRLGCSIGGSAGDLYLTNLKIPFAHLTILP